MFFIQAAAVVLLALSMVSILPIIRQSSGVLRYSSLSAAVLLASTIVLIVFGVYFVWWPMNFIRPVGLVAIFVILSGFGRKRKFRFLRALVISIVCLPFAAAIALLIIFPGMLLIPIGVLSSGTTKSTAIVGNLNLNCEVVYHPGFAAPGFTTYTLQRKLVILPFLQQTVAQKIIADEDDWAQGQDVCNQMVAKNMSFLT
jgi:hypothetical protein